ncbi:uncharacterized protein LOC135398716 [Ornithodoros turicata]|uniref:uncharacterized protein LOC135398716 n=1 Tax=Ornithodoros turicata TaxID=34597 RepID=UPI003139E988
MSQLDQMRAQFQERHNMRSGLPRPTKSSIPAPTSRLPTVAASRGGSDVRDGPLNGISATHITSKNHGDPVAANKIAVRNGISHTGSAKLNGHTKAPASVAPPQPRAGGGGVLTTMTTAQLRNLAISRQTNGSAANTGVPSNKVAPRAVASNITKPAYRKPLAPAQRKPVEPAVRTKAPEPAKKITAITPSQPPASSVRKPVSASKPSTLTSRSAPVPRTTSAKGTDQKGASKAVLPAERPLGPNQERCDICGRGFDKDRIEKHRGICKKAASKKVKVFDATKMRTKGTEVEAYVKRGLHKKQVPVKKSNWRAQHEEFIATVRQAKQVQEHLAAGGKLSDLPPPPPSSNPDYVPCPHCGRKFNESAAERHIPRCKEMSTRKPASAAASRKPSGYR